MQQTVRGAYRLSFAVEICGVREGTIIAALLVGFIARLFGRRLSFLEPLLFSKKQQATGENAGETAVEESAAAKRPVIVIGPSTEAADIRAISADCRRKMLLRISDQTCIHLPSSEALLQTALQRRTISAPSRNDGQAGSESSVFSS